MRDWGKDLTPKKLEMSFFANKCPRCGSRAENPRSRYWSRFGLQCRWLSDTSDGGFECNQGARERKVDGPDARR